MLQSLLLSFQIFFSFVLFSPFSLMLFFIDGIKWALPVIELTVFDLILRHKAIQLVQFHSYWHCLACYLSYLRRPLLLGLHSWLRNSGSRFCAQEIRQESWAWIFVILGLWRLSEGLGWVESNIMGLRLKGMASHMCPASRFDANAADWGFL